MFLCFSLVIHIFALKIVFVLASFSENIKALNRTKKFLFSWPLLEEADDPSRDEVRRFHSAQRGVFSRPTFSIGDRHKELARTGYPTSILQHFERVHL